MEQKIIRYFDAELRAAEDGQMSVEGYALKFDRETVIGSSNYGWREKIARTALDGAKLDDVVLNFNHSSDHILARTTNRSLILLRDVEGLKIQAKIVDTAIGRDVYKLIKEGLISRMSFAAIIKTSAWTIAETETDMDLREITAIERLLDVSAVTFPAYEDTSISVRGDGVFQDADAESHFRKRQYESQIRRLNKILGGTKP